MKMSSSTKYGIRAALDLALAYGKGVVTLADISKRKDISYKYLEQITSFLKRAGITTTLRGPKGGMKLARPPKQIRLSEIVRSLDGPDVPVECPKHKKFTKDCSDCVTRAVVKKYRRSLWDLLDSLTLQDLIELKKSDIK